MAVHVNIPGMGQVEASNAAEEQTLRQLLSVMSNSVTRTRRMDTDMARTLREQSAAAEDASRSMGSMASSTRMASNSTASYYSQLNENLSMTNSGFGGLGSTVASFGAALIATSSAIATNWAKTIGSSDIADPIRSTVDSMNMAVNLGVMSVSTFSNAVGGVAKMGGLEKIGKAVRLTGDNLSEFSGKILVGLNNKMASEMGQTIKSMGDFAKMGGTFVGGATEMRNTATQAGLTLDQFTRVVKNNRDSIAALNIGIVPGANAVSKALGYMEVATSDSSKTGRTFRNELRAMGYEVEDQAALTAQYMVNMKAGMTQDQIRGITVKQISEGTMEYAKNLKVLSDFTGKDAKAAMDRARQESQKGDIIARLQGDPEKLKKFQAIYASTPDTMKKGLLEMISTGGMVIDAATNQVIAQNADAGVALQKAYTNVMDGSVGLEQATTSYQSSIRTAANTQKAMMVAGDGQVAMISRISGAHQAYADQMNELATFSGDPNQPKKTAAANEALLQSLDPVTKGYVQAADSTQQFAVYMSNLATKVLPNYSTVIGNSAATLATVIASSIATITGEKSTKELVSDVKGSYKNFENSLKDMFKKVPRQAEGGIVNGGQLAVVGEAGAEAIIPLSGGRSVPVEFSGKGMKPDTSGLAAKDQAATATATTADKVPEMISTAMQSILSGPSGFASVMMDVKGQLASDSKEQLSVMQSQVDKLALIVSELQNNVRASERIGYALG